MLEAGDENKQLKWNQQNETTKSKKAKRQFSCEITLQWRRQTTIENWISKIMAHEHIHVWQIIYQ